MEGHRAEAALEEAFQELLRLTARSNSPLIAQPQQPASGPPGAVASAEEEPGDAMALSKLSGDEQGIVLGQLINALEPRLAMYFSSVNKELRALLQRSRAAAWSKQRWCWWRRGIAYSFRPSRRRVASIRWWRRWRRTRRLWACNWRAVACWVSCAVTTLRRRRSGSVHH